MLYKVLFTKKMGERLRRLILTIIAVSIVVMFAGVLLRTFDQEDAQHALGETYDFSDGWTVTYADGTVEEDVTLPITLPKDNASKTVIANVLKSDYAGLTMNMHVDNASVQTYVNGTLTYEEGTEEDHGKNTLWKGGKKAVEKKVESGPPDGEPTDGGTTNTTPPGTAPQTTDQTSDGNTETQPSQPETPTDTSGTGDYSGDNNSQNINQNNNPFNRDSSNPGDTRNPAGFDPSTNNSGMPENRSSSGSPSPENRDAGQNQGSGQDRLSFSDRSFSGAGDSINNRMSDIGANSSASDVGGIGSGRASEGINSLGMGSANDQRVGSDSPGNNASVPGEQPKGSNDRSGSSFGLSTPFDTGDADIHDNSVDTKQADPAQSLGTDASETTLDIAEGSKNRQTGVTDNIELPDESPARTSENTDSTKKADNKDNTNSESQKNTLESVDKQTIISDGLKEVDKILKQEETTTDNKVYKNKVSADDFMVDIPNSAQDGDVVIMVFEQGDYDHSVQISAPQIAQRDAVVISKLRKSVLPLVCCILIIIFSAILVTLDATRIVSKTRPRGLIRLALLAMDMLLYSFLGTNIMVLFFNNELFFMVVQDLCYALVPMLLAWFFERGFRMHYPKRTEILMWITSIYAFICFFLETTRIIVLASIDTTTLGVQLFTLGMIISMLLSWKKDSEGYNTVWMDVTGYLFLTISLLMNPLNDFYPGVEVFDTIKILSTTACFLFLTCQHVHIVLSEYRERANAAANRLAREKKTVEEQNEKLAIAQAQAEDARLEAELANEAKGNFLANMSHEIRTPINAVLGMDEMILRESKEKDIRGYAMDIFTAGNTLLSLINDILDFSKIESGKMEIVPVDYDISSLINDLYNMIAARAKSKDLIFEVEMDETLPSRFYGDDVRIRQVLTNILTNAVKYTPEGHVWFRISGRRNDNEEILRFEVEDTGIGIKEEDLPKLYEAYQRIEEGRNRNIEGTGLGMNITLQLLNLMGSRLNVESVYGKGSKFWFELNQRITNDSPVGNLQERIQTLSDNYSYTESFIAPDANILVVDDNSMNRKVFLSLLKPTQVKITEAESGQEAINHARNNHYDIIFMDHMMPEMDGIEAMKRIRSIENGPCEGTPIYVLTANAVSGAKEEYLKVGFDGFVSKPVVSDKLEEVIRNALPKDMVLPAPESEGEIADSRSSSDNSFIDELPQVDGLDWYFAFLHLPDKELLEDTVKEFASVLNSHSRKLCDMYDRLPDKEAYESYRIFVHGMKSQASTVGIVPLAGTAKILEYAARDFDEDTIRRLHPVFINEWNSYSDKLKGVFGIGEEDISNKPRADMNHVRAILEMLLSAMEDFDVDQADELVGQLLEFSYDDAVYSKIMDLKVAVADLDDDSIERIVRDIA